MNIKHIILLLVCATIVLTSCSDDDKTNTTDAIVSMKQPTMDVKENKLFQVPIVVSGEQNGPIYVTVDVTTESTNYIKDTDFIVTSYTITIPKHKKEATVEISLKDDRIINDNDRILEVKITKAEGASIDNLCATSKVNVIDNDNNPYERLASKWIASITDGFTGSPFAWETEIICYDDTDENYGRELLLSPIYDANGNIISTENGNVAIPIKFSSYKSGGKDIVQFKIECGTIIAEGINFDTTGEDPNLQDCRLRIVSLGATGMITSGQITGRLSDTFDSVEFDMPIICEILTKTNQTFSYLFYYDRMEMNMK